MNMSKWVIILLLFLTSYSAQSKWWNYLSSSFEENIDTCSWSTDVRNPVWQNPIQIDSIKNSTTGFLGQFGKQKIIYQSQNIPEHDSVRISYDLIIINTWDGNKDSKNVDTPDLFIMQADDKSLINTTFSLNEGQNQAYPDDYPKGNFPWKTSSNKFITYGITKYAIFRIEKVIPHINYSLSISLEANLKDNFPNLSNESWAIDNFNIQYHQADFEIRVWLPDTFAIPSQSRFEIPLKAITNQLKSPRKLAYTTTLGYDAGLFLHEQCSANIISNKIEDGIRKITISGTAEFSNDSTIPMKLTGKIYLSGNQINPLMIYDFSVNDSNCTYSLKDGSITIDVCAFGIRQIKLKPTITYDKFVKNNMLVFKFENGVLNCSSIDIYNSYGQLTASRYSEIIELNDKVINLHLNSIPSGWYFFRMKSESNLFEGSFIKIE